jgi:small subunit ribosomal protein S6
MFLFDTSKAGDMPAMESEVSRLMQRADAELLTCRKWDERKLAFEIGGRKRGCYVLSYFKAPPEKIADLERDAQLSESVLRLLVLRAERITEEQMKTLTPAEEDAAEREGAARRRAAAEAARQESTASSESVTKEQAVATSEPPAVPSDADDNSAAPPESSEPSGATSPA